MELCNLHNFCVLQLAYKSAHAEMSILQFHYLLSCRVSFFSISVFKIARL
jgi:hypothetical protein